MLMPALRNVEDYIFDIYTAILDAAAGSDHRYSHTIRQCLAYIAMHYSETISLDNMANTVDISKSYLSMLFKQEMGINFISYLTQFRVNRAKELLSNSGKKIYEIADEVGFSSPYYFSKVFKELTGMTCKEYRDAYYAG